MEEQSKEIYGNLLEYCNERAGTFGKTPPVFEPVEVFDKCCLDLKLEHLLSIKDVDQFVRACFLKVLDNLGSSRKERMAATPLKLGLLSREGFVNRITKTSTFVEKKVHFKFLERT